MLFNMILNSMSEKAQDDTGNKLNSIAWAA